MDSSKDEHIARLSPEQLACRGGRHDWPLNHLRLNHALPRGMKAVQIPETYGVWQMEETCPVCGTERIWTTGRGHSFRSDTVFSYVYPDNWVRIPRDIGVTSRDCLAVNIDLCSGMLFGED